MDRPGHLVVAYHGCDETVRDKLLDSGSEVVEVKASKNPYDWLGDGAYFFEDDWMRALFFAQAACKHPALSKGEIRKPAVVGAAIRVHRWLDLGTSEGRSEYLLALKDLKDKGTTLQKNGPSPNQLGKDDILRKLDRQVINHIHKMRKAAGLPSYDAVRAYFPQGNGIAETSAFHQDTHIQIALRNAQCVLGYFRVRQAEVPAA